MMYAVTSITQVNRCAAHYRNSEVKHLYLIPRHTTKPQYSTPYNLSLATLLKFDRSSIRCIYLGLEYEMLTANIPCALL